MGYIPNPSRVKDMSGQNKKKKKNTATQIAKAHNLNNVLYNTESEQGNNYSDKSTDQSDDTIFNITWWDF